MKAVRILVALVLWPFRWLAPLFTWQVRLRRRGGRWRIALEDPHVVLAQPYGTPKTAAAPSTGKPESAPVAGTADAMKIALSQLLAQHGATRQLMRHLAYLERALKLSGTDAIANLPLDVLRKALAQLEELVTDWSSPGLAQLRLQLTMVIADKEEAARTFQPTNDMASEFAVSRQMQVCEVSASDFDAVEQAWAAAGLPGSDGTDGAGKP